MFLSNFNKIIDKYKVTSKMDKDKVQLVLNFN